MSAKKQQQAEESLFLPEGFSPKAWRYWVPNALTILSCVTGLSSIKWAFEDNYPIVVLCIIVAGILDTLDGPAARALGATSEFGAQLDSLMDLINFGVCPGIVLYIWGFEKLGWPGFFVSLVYTASMACRLARFNAGIDYNAAKWSRSFFMGVPAPAGAFLALVPLIASFQFGKEHFTNPAFLVPYTLVASFMLISKIPTFSSKMFGKDYFKSIGSLGTIVFVGVVVGTFIGLVIFPWLTLLAVAVGYYISFPISYFTFRGMLKAQQQQQASTPKNTRKSK